MVATVLTACGIETETKMINVATSSNKVATVLTACGIETIYPTKVKIDFFELQQCLPLAVLKRSRKTS